MPSRIDPEDWQGSVHGAELILTGNSRVANVQFPLNFWNPNVHKGPLIAAYPG